MRICFFVLIIFVFNFYEVPSQSLTSNYKTTKDQLNYKHITAIYQENRLDPPQAKIISSSNSFCEGDSLQLQASPDGFHYKWSTGETTQSIYVKQAGKYYLEVSDDAGASSRDSITVTFSSNLQPQIVIKGNNPPCEGDSIILKSNLTGKKYNILWSTGSTNDSIIVSKSGIYRLSVSLNNNCTGTDSISIKYSSNPKPHIIGNTILCGQDRVYISADSDYASYLWSTGETTKTIAVASPGFVSLTVRNSDGCPGIDSVEITKHTINISGMNILELDTVCVEQDSYKSFLWQNIGGSEIEIQNIYTKNPNGIFSIEYPMSFPYKMQAGDTLPLLIKFRPQLPQYYFDSLFCTISQPCQVMFKTSINGTGMGIVKFSLADTTVMINTDVCIPVFVQTVCDNDSVPQNNYYVRVKFPADAMIPRTPNIYYLNGSALKDTNLSGLQVRKAKTKIGEICGTAVLASSDTVRFTIDSTQSYNKQIKVISENGNMILTGLCRQELLRLKKIQTSQMIVNFNSELINIEIEYKIGGRYRLSLITLDGSEFVNREWYKNNDDSELKTIQIDNETIGSGLYFIRLKSDFEVINIPFILAK